MSKNIFVGVILSGGIIFGSACSHDIEPQPTALNQTLVQTTQHRQALKKAAKAGDGAAAYQLFQYYAFVQFNKAQYSYWLKRAVKLRYRPAIISLGNLLCESSDVHERQRGRELLRQVGVEDPTVPHRKTSGSL